MDIFAPPDAVVLVMAALMLVSAVLQTATGFGFAILSAPLGALLLGAPEIVSTVMIVGTSVDLLILGVRREARSPRWDEVAILGVSSIPGLLLGAVLLATLPQRVLMLVIAAAVVLAVVLRLITTRKRAAEPQPVSRGWGAVAGLASGALGTSTTLAGPPTVLYLSRRPYGPSAVRDTLVALNLVRLPLSVAALVVSGAFVVVPGVGWMVLAALAGFGVGSRVFAGLDARRYEAVVLGVLLLAAVCAASAAVLG